MPEKKYRQAKNNSSGLEKFLGELQLAIMEIVWERQPIKVADVLTILNEAGRNLAYTTVMTVMSRLDEKGWLLSEKHGRAFVYRATYLREEAQAVAVAEVIRSLLQDFGDLAVAQFVKELDDIDSEQLSRLAEMAREREENNEKD
jgi:predicted transcriptional regulator